MSCVRRGSFFIIIFVVIHLRLVKTFEDEPDYYHYLQRFGYTPKVEGRRLFSVLAKSSYSEGILKLQRLFKLPVRAINN